MDGKCAEETAQKEEETPDPVRHQNDVDDVANRVGQREKKAEGAEVAAKTNDCDIPMKKRRTRRGKHKRRYPPYNRNERNKSSKVVKPEAPYNSNQFLLEDHGIIEELDENLRHADRISSTTTSNCRTRDSSFSVDSDGEFYSSPDDEEQFLIKDFVDQYESVQAERLQSMSKDELIREYLILESKLELLTKRQRKKANDNETVQEEVERLTLENEALRRENAVLRSKCTTSEDSESDSSTDDDDSTCSSSCSSEAHSPLVDYSKTNGHATSVETV